MSGFEQTALEAHQRVSFQSRQRVEAELERLVLTGFEAQLPRGPSSRFTPYVPLTLAVGAWLTDVDGPGSMLLIRRKGMDLVNGQPRLFSPARGIGISFLDLQLGLGLDAHRDLYLHHHLLHFRYQPATLFRGPSVGAAGDLLRIDVDGRDRLASARWLEGGVLLTAVHGQDWRNHLEVMVGPALESLWALGDSHALLLEVPMALEAAANTLGPVDLHLRARVAWTPALTTTGVGVSMMEHQATAGLFLGQVADTGVELELGSRGRLPVRGEAAWLQPSWLATVGLKLERY